MAIIHNYSDKQLRKFKFTIYIYLTIFLVVSLVGISIYSIYQRNHINKQNEVVEEYRKKICLENDINEAISTKIEEYAKANKYDISDTPCDISIGRNVSDANEYNKVQTDTYVMVTRYDSEISNIDTTHFSNILVSQRYNGYSIVWNKEADEFLHSRYDIGVGQSSYSTNSIEKMVLGSNKVLAILPISELSAIYKVVSIDDNSPLEGSYNPQTYPLLDTYWIKGEDSNLIKTIFPTGGTSIDQSKLTSLLLTGSSAVGSGEMMGQSIKSAVSPVSSYISGVDIAQINNESSVASRCTQYKLSARLCTTRSYIEDLKYLGFDVVGVNGNHILDYGLDSFENTLDIYSALKLKTYGGGRNASEASRSLTVENNGNKASFLGYNFMYPFSYYATNKKAGSANIDEKIFVNALRNIPSTNISVVDMGWGYEDKASILSYQNDYVNLALRNGVDILIGTNSKVPQVSVQHPRYQ